ncbi:MAG: hypothetical protein AAF711_02000 [Planctomycetota bacterium]
MHYLTTLCYVLTTVFATSLAAESITYEAPEYMDGEAVGTSDANPMDVDGKPMWRAVQVYPPNPRVVENYKPMVWDGESWIASEESRFAGNPKITVEEQEVKLAGRAEWSGQNPKGHMIPALVFIAPTDGSYTLAADVMNNQWHGKREVKLEIYLLDRESASAKRVGSVILPIKESTSLTIEAFEVTEGQEIAFLPKFEAMHNASNIMITDLIITCDNSEDPS